MNFRKRLKERFSKGVAKSPRISGDAWERIGFAGVAPPWVQKEIERIYRINQAQGAPPLQTRYLKGKRYRYKLSPVHLGQAGQGFEVYRKRRRSSRKKVAWCLVEDDEGRILMVQRAYGSKKGKWSLPGGYVDPGESRRRAAYRETKEETGIVVEITHRLFTSRNRESAVFAGRRIGGRLKYQRGEALDARWRDPAKIEPFELAFGGDHKALKLWRDIKSSRATPEETYGAG